MAYPEDQPPFQPEEEIRFAVVLYGGVSLAIYINGVVQELFALIRSTAPRWPLAADLENRRVYFRTNPGVGEKGLRGSERVYRRLGQLARLSGGGKPLTSLPRLNDPVRTRFVVDILSGTSAGGINGVFLAKAIANQQDISALKQLWIDEGDIEDLLNDRRSYRGLPTRLRPQSPPPSLLNGYRLYVRTLDALRAMNATTETPAQQDSPSYAEELELAVTTTDLQGLLLPIKLYDTVVYERRHRNVFKFKFATEEATGSAWNDFKPENDAMLAFAARCTSSFPFAFEPMVMDDLKDVLPRSDYPVGDVWRSFFRDYDRIGATYRRYAFADGGYLDNKPFSHATETLRRRRADLPVDRKLIYVEPDPKRPPDEGEPALERPDALGNVGKALVALPRSEPIRDDIAAVVEQNRVVRRMRSIVRAAEKVVLETAQGAAAAAPGYEQLRARVVVDAIADAVVGSLNIARDSDAAFAAELVVQEWAAMRDAPTLVTSFDLPYRLRRLAFLQDRINAFLRGDDEAITIMLGAPAAEAFTLTDAQRRSLVALKTALNEVFVALRKHGRTARRAGDDENLALMRKELAALVPDADTLVKNVLAPDAQLAKDGDDEATERARSLVGGPDAAPILDTAAFHLATYFASTFAAADEAIALVLSATPLAAAADAEPAALAMLRTRDPLENDEPQPLLLGMLDDVPAAVRDALQAYVQRFAEIDSVLLPLTYPNLGEVNAVEIIRISPHDATSLIDELGTPRQKLAGVSVSHFGGFLDKRFRENDILWGRLDAADRIVTTTMPPNHELVDVLVEAAQLAIIGEDLLTDGPDWVAAALAKPIAPAEDAAKLLDLLGPGWDTARLDRARAVREYLKTDYDVDRTLDDAKILSVVGRATTITGDVLKVAGDARSVPTKPLFWVSRFGRLLWGLAELATPRRATSLPRVVFRNIALVTLLVGVVLVVLGVAGVEAAQKVGWIVIAAVLGACLVVWLTAGWLRIPPRQPERAWMTVVRALLLFAAAATLAAIAVADDLPRSSIAGWIAPTLVILAAVVVGGWAVARVAVALNMVERETGALARGARVVRAYVASALLALAIVLSVVGLAHADRTAAGWFVALLATTAVVAGQDLLPRGRRLVRTSIALVAVLLVAATVAEIVYHSSEDAAALVAKLPGDSGGGFEGTLRDAWCGFDRELWPWGATEQELRGRCG
ncbi:MAG TPA: patatin-like protein [Gaiellaceae bacterium]|nr:patatin-like protein [Gaiellaceae bacterium]